jgi:3-dehydroquinate synthase class II
MVVGVQCAALAPGRLLFAAAAAAGWLDACSTIDPDVASVFRLQVRALMRYLEEQRQQGAQQLQYETATVTAVRPVGMGDRACVDLCR